jgi:hypothetical protein
MIQKAKSKEEGDGAGEMEDLYIGKANKVEYR